MAKTVKLQELVPVEGKVAEALAEAIAKLGETPTATRDYAERADWPTKEGERVFAKGQFADHRDPKVQDLVLILAESLNCPQYASAANLHCPYMGRLALASARARAAKEAVAEEPIAS